MAAKTKTIIVDYEITQGRTFSLEVPADLDDSAVDKYLRENFDRILVPHLADGELYVRERSLVRID